MALLTQSFNIITIIDNLTDTKNSYTDFGWVIENPNWLGEPQIEEHTTQIPFGNELDLTRNILGFPIFTTRDLTFKIGVPLGTYTSWANYSTYIRSYYEGKKVKIIMDDDTSWYWEGTAHIEGIDGFQTLGKFTLKVHCDAYKHYITENKSILVAQTIPTGQTRTVQLPDSPYPAETRVTVDNVGTFTQETAMQWTLNGKTVYRVFQANSSQDAIVPFMYSRSPIFSTAGYITITRGGWDEDLIFTVRKRSL